MSFQSIIWWNTRGEWKLAATEVGGYLSCPENQCGPLFSLLNLDSRSFDRAGYLLPYMISRAFSIAFVISSFVEVHSQNTAGHERKFLFFCINFNGVALPTSKTLDAVSQPQRAYHDMQTIGHLVDRLLLIYPISIQWGIWWPFFFFFDL